MATTANGHDASDDLLRDPELAEMLLLLHARDSAPAADPVFAARLRGELEDQIAAVSRAAAISATTLPRLMVLPAVPAPVEAGPASLFAAPTASLPWYAGRHIAAYAATAVLFLVILLTGSTAWRGHLGWGDLIGAVRTIPSVAVPPATLPDPATQQGLLTQMTAPALPLATASFISIERWTVAAGAEPVTSQPRSGPILIFPISGTLTVTLDQAGYVVREMGRRAQAPVAAGQASALAAGDTLLIPTNATATIGNDSGQPTTALVLPIIDGTARDWQAWFAAAKQTRYEELVTGYATFQPGPARIELTRATLQPGEKLPAPPDGAYRLVATESKYLGYLRRSPDGSVTNLEKTPLGVLILTVSQPYPNLTVTAP